tara:strand:- start:45 stop:725 length:681 start_codon:yes stop_codon:yes gene_type:complete
MYKKHTYITKSGTQALEIALKTLKSKIVIIPTYTCKDVLMAVLNTNCEPIIVDYNKNLQIDLSSTKNIINKADTIIIPHMFGIQTPVLPFYNKGLNIIEDLSQCHGLPELGKYANIVISSTNKSKWLDNGGGGYIFFNEELELPKTSFNWDIETKYNIRKNKAQELLNAGLDLIGKDKPNSWLRGMYFTDNPKRKPYIPLHEIYGKFDCPIVDSYSNKIDWISIFD